MPSHDSLSLGLEQAER